MKKEITGADEDVIFKNKIFLNGLKQVENLYFETLCGEMDLNEKGCVWLFDYLFNYDEEKLSFGEYLEEYRVKEEDIFNVGEA